jgi:hypothetical protein
MSIRFAAASASTTLSKAPTSSRLAVSVTAAASA